MCVNTLCQRDGGKKYSTSFDSCTNTSWVCGKGVDFSFGFALQLQFKSCPSSFLKFSKDEKFLLVFNKFLENRTFIPCKLPGIDDCKDILQCLLS